MISVSQELSWITLQNMLITFFDLYQPVGKNKTMRDIHFRAIITPKNQIIDEKWILDE